MRRDCGRAVLGVALLLSAVVGATTGCGDDDGATAPDASASVDAASAGDGGPLDASGPLDGGAPGPDGATAADAAAVDAGVVAVDAGGPVVDSGPPRDPSMLCMQSCEKMAACAGMPVAPACVTGCTTDAADCSNPQQDALAACLAQECDTYIACIAAVGCIMSAGG